MCQPELKPPSVEIWAIRSRIVLVSAATVVVTAAIAALAPIAPPTTKAIRTAHFFVRSMRINPPLRVDAGILPQSVRCLPRLRARSGTLAQASVPSVLSPPVARGVLRHHPPSCLPGTKPDAENPPYTRPDNPSGC